MRSVRPGVQRNLLVRLHDLRSSRSRAVRSSGTISPVAQESNTQTLAHAQGSTIPQRSILEVLGILVLALAFFGVSGCAGGFEGFKPVAATITQPASVTVGLGQTATFSVTAGGSGTLTYQWYKNGTAIIGATSSSYTTPPTVSSDTWRRIYSHCLELRRHRNKRTGNPNGSDARTARQESGSQCNHAPLQLVRVADSHFLGRYSHHRFDRRREFRHHRRGRKRHFVSDSAVNLAQNVHADGHGLQKQRCSHDLPSHANCRRDLADFPSEPNCRSGPDYFCSHCDWWCNQWSHLDRDCRHLQRERVDFSHRCWYLHHHRNQRGRAVRLSFRLRSPSARP